MEAKVSFSSKKFEKTCSMKGHVSSNGNADLHDLDQRRFISAPERQYMFDEHLMKDTIVNHKGRKTYVCDECLQLVRQMMLNPTKKQKMNVSTADDSITKIGVTSNFSTDEAITVISDAIQSDAISKQQINRILKCIGIRLNKSFKESRKPNQVTREDDMKTQSYLNLWQQEKNLEWKQLLEYVCDLSEPIDDSSARRLTKCTDLVRVENDQHYISNVALSEALLLLQFSHSKYAVDVFCKTNAAGSFSTVRRTMALLGSDEFCLPATDVIIAFDNNQVIQRTWMFKYGGKQTVSTVTTLACYTNTNKTTDYQFRTSIPTSLFPSDSNRHLLLARYKELTSQAASTHRLYRKTYIESRLETVSLECELVEGAVKDNISSDEVPVPKEDCVFTYTRVPSRKRTCRVQDIDCMPENPNSFRAVATVLDKILEYVNASSLERKYIPVYMDGAPYAICMKLLRERYVCEICGVDVDTMTKNAHSSTHNLSSQGPSWRRKYKKIVIRQGNGHTEMTAVRTIISIFWIPFIKPFARIFGYNSESQLEYCKKAYDHHKSYILLMVIYAALSAELLYPYIRRRLLHGMTPTYEGYCSWSTEIEKENQLYRLASSFCFTTLHSLHLFRCGIRTCNDDITFHARHKLTALLYGWKNVKYQEILCYDTSYLLSLNPENRKILMNESACREEGEAGDGYDFLLENRNKLYKSFLISDSAPTFEQWLQVCRTAMDLEEIRLKAADRLDLQIRPSDQRPRKFTAEIRYARQLIRNHGFLLKKKHGLTTIDDEKIKLDPSFLNFVQHSEKNRDCYYEAYFRNEKSHLPLINCEIELEVQATNEEELRAMVQRKLNMLHEPFYSG